MTWTAAAAVLAPCAGGVIGFAAPPRARAVVGAAAAAVAAGIAALLAIRVATGGAFRVAVGGWAAPLGIELRVDGLSALMVITQAAVALPVGAYALRYFVRRNDRAVFWPLWLLLWGALNGLYVTGDLFNAYVALELIGVTAVGLVALAGGPALAAGVRYLLVTFVGSLTYLAGVALIYAQAGVVDLDAVAVALGGEPAEALALGLMAAALLLKTAAFPMHFWLPPAHAYAASPVSAVLSALVIKSSFYLLVRLWASVFSGAVGPAIGEAIGALGIAAVMWGSAQALRQARLKLLVAYSTVAQVGYLLTAFAIGGIAWRGALYFAVAHAGAKAAMFTAAGTMQRQLGHDDIADLGGAANRLPVTMFAFALAGVTSIGLPPSGGFIGKWMLIEGAILGGRWGYVAAISIGTLLSVAYVFRAVNSAFAETGDAPVPRPPALLEAPPLVLALAALALGFASAPVLALLEVGRPLAGLP